MNLLQLKFSGYLLCLLLNFTELFLSCLLEIVGFFFVCFILFFVLL